MTSVTFNRTVSFEGKIYQIGSKHQLSPEKAKALGSLVTSSKKEVEVVTKPITKAKQTVMKPREE